MRREYYEYDAMGRMTALTDAAGNRTAYTYDSRGNRTMITYADKSRDRFTYDVAGNLLRKETAAGNVTEYTYDLKGSVLSETSGENRITYTYYPNGKLHTKQMSDGLSYTYTYDSSWNCILVTDSEGGSTGYTYDRESNLTSQRDGMGNTIHYTYDCHGRMTKMTDPMGNSTYYGYDENGNCTSQTDAAGKTTHTEYDALNRPVKITVETADEKLTQSYAYDAVGRVIRMTDEEGRTTHIAYDGFGNISTITDEDGNILTKNTWDNMDRLLETTDEAGVVTAYSYDSLDRVTKAVSGLNGSGTGNTYVYDADGRLLSVTDAAGGRVSQTYDERGNMTSLTDARGGKTGYSYDSMNRITSVTNAIGGTESYTYNARGLPEERKDASGEKTQYTYDAAGRIIRQKDGLGAITYTYDKNGNILTVSDKNGTITRTYDAMNRVTAVTDYKGRTVKYSYDQLGNRIAITYPGGEKVRYTYNRNGTLSSVTDTDGNVTYYTYDKNSRLAETRRSDGSVEACTYDKAGRLTSITDTTASRETISSYEYTYDEAGNIVYIEGVGTTPGSIAEDTASGEPTGGTLSEAEKQAVTVSMTYDGDNRLITYGGEAVTYDADGNMLHGPLNGEMADFTYDCRNRLVKVKEGDGTVTAYEYDAENVRTAKITGGIRTEYTTDREAEYSQTLVKTDYEKNAFGQYTKECGETLYTYGLGLSSEKRKDGDVYYYHYNNLGSTTAVTDENGKIVYRFFYGTYGELTDMTNAEGASLKYSEETKEFTAGCTLSELASAAGMEYLYNGQYGVSTDKNGLYYMRARYYDQDIKRFINRDVLSGETTNSQSLNRYAYVQGSPVSLTDPFGLCPDSSSAFKNFCIGVANFDWKAAGHTALDTLGLLWDGADWLNVAWYLAEGNIEQASASAICALPGAGMALGGKMMKSRKLYKAGKIVKVISAGAAGGMGLAAGGSMIMAGITNIMNGLEEGRIDFKGVTEVVLGGAIAYCSGKGMAYNFKGLLSAGDNAARSSRISETASETMASGKGSTNAAEPPSVYGKGCEIETNGFGPDTIINRNANYGAKTADPSYGVSARPIGEYRLGTTNPSRSYTTGTSRMGTAAGAEEKIWLKAADGAGASGVPGRHVQGSLGSTGLSVGKPKVPDVPEIGGKGISSGSDINENPNPPAMLGRME